ncbi:MAG: cupin domain-containing protein [Truepera sp.]|nr:cupin domain-containing protein [Truepera sp.]
MTTHHDLSTLLPETPPESIVSRTIYQDEHYKVVLFSFAAGQELSEHTSSRPAILHVLTGEARLTLGDEVIAAAAGSWAFMPPHLKHSLTAKTPVQMLLTLLDG